MLQDEIVNIEEYFRGIEYFNKAVIVRVVFPDKWQVFPSKDGKIKPAKADNGEYYYYGSSEEVTLDDVFELIKATITSNKHAEEKIAFLLEKRKELDELFRTTQFEKLKTLKFVFDEKKPRRKYSRKKKETEEVVSTEGSKLAEHPDNSDVLNASAESAIPMRMEGSVSDEAPKKRRKKKMEEVEDGNS